MKASPSRGDYLVFDIETQRSSQEVGGWHNLAQMGVSIAVAHDNGSGSTFVYRDYELDLLIEQLQQANLIVGFNLLRFDYSVLQPYTSVPLQHLPTFDILDNLWQQLGFRLSLDNLAGATLNVPKSGTGLLALEWFRNKEWDKLIAYCKNDVFITRDLFEFGRTRGFVKFHDSYTNRVRKIPVDW